MAGVLSVSGLAAMTADVFPSTRHTWLQQEMLRGPQGRSAVNAYLMDTYAHPLRVYYLGTNARWLGEPEDVIGGFFASRLGREEFLDKWHASGLRLRRWLMNAFCFYLMEMRRQRRRDAAVELSAEPVTFTGDPQVAVDRAAVVAFVRKAMEEARAACVREGLEPHWRVFLRHHVDAVSFRQLAVEFDVDPARAAVMSRTATRKLRAALRDVLERDGVPPDEIDQEIHVLLEACGP
jgi:DNA-directed RNA polymerase specialized sigma24 family protein